MADRNIMAESDQSKAAILKVKRLTIADFATFRPHLKAAVLNKATKKLLICDGSLD
jgi:hypothetical protein